MRIASWSWGGRPHVGTLDADGTPLAVDRSDRGALSLIRLLAREPQWPIENRFEAD